MNDVAFYIMLTWCSYLC